MSKTLYDYLGKEINPGDIVKREIKKIDTSPEVTYFYYGFNAYNNGFMYVCDECGNIGPANRLNFPVDNSITLISNDDKRWIRIGKRD